VIENGGVVPSAFWFEVLYGLAGLQRRRIVSPESVETFVIDLSELSITVDAALTAAEMISLRKVASRHGLSIFEASYLDLALRAEMPIATRDKSLAEAARRAGARLFTV